MICDNIRISEDGRHLLFAGQDVVELAKKYGTPLYLMDEDKIREKCRLYKNALHKYYGEKARPLYASKANCFKRLYEIMSEEGMGIDVVSAGEIYTALQAGYDIQNAYFHSNNKTDWDIRYAIEHNIGYFVADNAEEVDAIDREAKRQGKTQKILLRLTPGIDTHTFEAVSTGKVDSKFGQAIETGQAEEITKHTLAKENISLEGFHCHLGSQIFAEDVFERGAVIMLEFIARMREAYGYTCRQLDLLDIQNPTRCLILINESARLRLSSRQPARNSRSRCRRSAWNRADPLWVTPAWYCIPSERLKKFRDTKTMYPSTEVCRILRATRSINPSTPAMWRTRWTKRLTLRLLSSEDAASPETSFKKTS